MSTVDPARFRVCVVGAAGRMGSRVVGLLEDHPRLALASALDKRYADATTKPKDERSAGVLLTADPAQALAAVEVAIDFSAPPVCGHLAGLCAQRRVAYVVGSTGLGAEDEQALAQASQEIPILAAPNFSVGVNVLLRLVEQAARALGQDFDPEIFELHHRGKRDAPSGTALALGEAVRRERPGLEAIVGRSGAHQRAADELGYGSLRGGDASGEHTVFFLGHGERLELTHRATTPDIFVTGALRAAVWLVGRPAGRYVMGDVLGADPKP